MHFTELFIRRPVMTTLVMLAILLFGAMSYRFLPVSDLPNVDFPTILVTADLPGASPETMASAVATPLERQFSTIAGLDSMSSTNALGLSQITLQFNLSRSLDAAAQDVQAAIGKACQAVAPGHAHPAGLPEGEPRGSAGPLPGGEVRHPAPVHGERVRRHPHGPAHLHDQRRGPGPDLRGAEICGARPAGPQGPGQPGPRH